MARPRPEDAHALDELIAELRALKVYAGNPSLRQMEKLSGLARSTLADALSPRRKTAPAFEVFRGLLRAFSVPENEAEPWLAAWRRVQTEPSRGSAVVP